jgi:hypothetical protein
MLTVYLRVFLSVPFDGLSLKMKHAAGYITKYFSNILMADIYIPKRDISPKNLFLWFEFPTSL